MNESISEDVPLLPREQIIEVIPDVVVALILGATTVREYLDGDGTLVELRNERWHLTPVDYEMADGVSCELQGELNLGRFGDAFDVLRIRRHAVRKVKEAIGFISGQPREKSVAMLKDTASSGWWRMVLPAQHMEREGWRFDCTAAVVDFDALLEYDTIMVQRVHDWESYYTLKRLQGVGKHIVYDIDDDLFNITPDHPAYNTITRDDQIAAAKCMQMADLVTTTTTELQRRLTGIMDGVAPLVVPNAWDIEDDWAMTDLTGSPDEFQRIFWSGGASHAEDWNECFEAVSGIMKDRDNVRLVIMGFLPPCIEAVAFDEPFRDRIEFIGFRSPETYYGMVHHVRAEVGLAPLRSTGFNAAKSPIKYLEYSTIGMPTVASHWEPYGSVITDKKDGRLVSGTAEWKSAIEFFLDRPGKRKEMVRAARQNCHQFDLNHVSLTWADLLCRE